MLKKVSKVKRLLFIVAFISAPALADDFRFATGAASATSEIEDSMCIPAIDGQGFLHVDEDVSGLIIDVRGEDGTQIALYDAAAEIEDIAAIGTYAAPTASNVRVSPQNASGGDCTQMMFADAVYSGARKITITVSDGQTTIMDYSRVVYLSAPTDWIDATSIATDSIDADAISDDGTAEIWAVSCEDQGSTYSCREAMSMLLSEAIGTCVYTSGTRTWVCKDPGGNETRFTIVYGAELDGDRTTSTPAPMTP